MPAGGESSVDAWTAALAARLQLDSPHASRLPTNQPVIYTKTGACVTGAPQRFEYRE